MHDDRVLKDALFTRNFKIPNKKYYLTNVEYYNIDYFLYLYHSIYYYLRK